MVDSIGLALKGNIQTTTQKERLSMKTKTWWFEVTTEDSELCGEQFFVEAPTGKEAYELAQHYFENEELAFYGQVSQFEAEMWGLDTY